MARNARQILAILASVAIFGLAAHPGRAAAAQRPVSSADRTTRTPSALIVNAVLSDMMVAVDRTSVPAGDVTFLIRNEGNIVHELVLLKTDRRFDTLPGNPDEAGKVFEDIHVGETGEMDVGAFGAFDAVLTAGHYVLLCDEPGHYMAGMRIAFTVTDPEVGMTLRDSSMSLDQPTVIAPRILLNVSNLSTGTEKVVVLRADGPGGTVAALARQSISAQTADVASGGSARFVVILGVGTYVVICVENGQYDTASQAILTVVAGPLYMPNLDGGVESDQ